MTSDPPGAVLDAACAAEAGTKLVLPQRCLLFLGDGTEPSYAKTAFGLPDWARDHCVGEFSCASGTVTTGLPRLTPEEARRAGARSLIIGIANEGGTIPDSWLAALVEALDAGLNIIGGMHSRLTDIPQLRDAANRSNCELIEMRLPPADLAVGRGRKRSGKRLLTVGTDCALGKKYAALALARAVRARAVDVDFRATGQTGILIADGGIPMDAVVSDFEAGALEALSPDTAPNHWDVTEGRGSLFHPSNAAVSLKLLHGSQPDVFVVCHDPACSTVMGLPDFCLPTTEEVIDLTTWLGSRTNPAIRCAGVALNTSAFDVDEASQAVERHATVLQVPVADSLRGGVAKALVDGCLT